MAHSSIHKSLGKGWSLRMYKSLWQNVILPQPVLLGVKIVKSRCWSQRNHGVLLKIVLVRTYIFPVPKKKDNFYVTKMRGQHKHMYFDHMGNRDGKDLETVSASERHHKRPPPCRG